MKQLDRPASARQDAGDRVRRLWAQAEALTDDVDPFDRLWLVTESYRATAGQPMILRRARAFAHFLAHQPVVFEDRVIFAGQPFRRISVHTGVDEANQGPIHWSYPEAGHLRPAHLPADAPPKAVAAAEYWADDPLPPLWTPIHEASDELTRKLMSHGVFQAGGLATGHQVPDFAGVLAEGLAPRLDRVAARLAQPGLEPAQRIFYEAAAIVLQAALDYAARLATAARAEAAASLDEVRAQDLGEVAETLDRVPAHPPRTFREALQMVWLLHRLAIVEQEGTTANSLGRFDQYLHPYYRADVDAGRLTRDDAQELVDAFSCKLYRLYDDQNVTLGGLRPDGGDGVNELSWMVLASVERLPYHRDVTVRVHRGTPEAFVRRAVEILRLGLGRPDFQNDEVVIPGLVERGLPLEVARDYAPVGCVEISIPGRSGIRTMAQGFNLLKVLELTLNEGRCLVTGDVLFDDVPAEFDTFAALHACYRDLVARCLDRAVEINLAVERAQFERLPHPFLSSINDGPLETGRDFTDGGCRYDMTGANLIGIADLANALFAVRQAVYAERFTTLADLRAALRADWTGREQLRAQMRRLPTFGNDHPEVDRLAADEARYWARRLERYRTAHGGFFFALLFGTTSNCVYGLPHKTGASPDGRCWGEPLSQSAQPATGTALEGPTALLNSVARLPGSDLCGGMSFVPDFDPILLEGDRGVVATAGLLRGYFAAGGAEIGPNVVDVETLRQAQREPSRYGHIFVRLFGYSARFTTLSPELQQYLIAKAQSRRAGKVGR